MVSFVSVQFSHSIASDSLRPHESQHARPPCPSPAPEVYPDSCPSSWWCHPAISSSVVPFFSCPQSLPASGSFPMSQLFAWGGQSIGFTVFFETSSVTDYWQKFFFFFPFQYCLSGHPSLPCNVLKFKSTTIMLDCGLDMTSTLNFLPLPLVQRYVLTHLRWNKLQLAERWSPVASRWWWLVCAPEFTFFP